MRFSSLFFVVPLFLSLTAAETIYEACMRIGRTEVKKHIPTQIQLATGRVMTVGPMIGEGLSARVYFYNNERTEVIKVFFADSLDEVEREFAGAKILAQKNLDYAKIIRKEKTHIIKEYIPGLTAREIIKTRGLTEEEFSALVALYKRLLKEHVYVDIHPGNFVLDSRSATPRWVLVDTQDITIEATDPKAVWAKEFFKGYPALRKKS